MFPSGGGGCLSFTTLLKVRAQATLSGHQTTAGQQLQQHKGEADQLALFGGTSHTHLHGLLQVATKTTRFTSEV